MEQDWQEPLHEYAQFASIIRKLLAYRHQKHVQYEMTQDALAAKRESLEDLEKHEREARRLADALGRGRMEGASSEPAPHPTEGDGARKGDAGEDGDGDGDGADEPEHPLSASLPPHPGPSPVRRRAPGMGLLSAISFTLHGMIDADPETARRNSISKTRETISQARPPLRFVGLLCES